MGTGIGYYDPPLVMKSSVISLQGVSSILQLGYSLATTGTIMNSTGISETKSRLIEITKTQKVPEDFYYVTYAKMNYVTGEVYVGRTSGYGSPEKAVKVRDYNHHMSSKGFGPAQVSTYAPALKVGGYGTRFGDLGYWAIRGSEQLQIEKYRQLGISGNDRNGIGKTNTEISKYLIEAIKKFGF